jgi:uncharacterized protein (DUF305 family)
MEPPPDLSELSLDQLVELERRAAEAEQDDLTAGGGGDTADAADDRDARGDGPVVLPWWQHPFNIAVLVVTAAILAGMVGWMVGESSGRPDHNDVDTGFLQDMRVHHEQAVLMSFIYRSRPDIDPGLSTVARGIIVGQSLEVGRMIQMLRTLGETEANETGTSMLWMSMLAEANQMPGIASDAELEELGKLEGRDADELFVKLMTRHHLGGIEMADFAVEHAEYDEVIKMAAGMSAGQRGEINEMINELD